MIFKINQIIYTINLLTTTPKPARTKRAFHRLSMDLMWQYELLQLAVRGRAYGLGMC